MPELMIQCVHCDHDMPIEVEYCGHCGQWLKCPECHERLPDPASVDSDDEDDEDDDEDSSPLEEEENDYGLAWFVISKTTQSITYAMSLAMATGAQPGVLIRTVTLVETETETHEAQMCQTFVPGVSLTDLGAKGRASGTTTPKGRKK